ncbi:hypothetical protein ACFY3N_21870 [Streptomyces sp. NPDC000348]|uniref:hypothetical protein n=1 Tax=Streptomyces sp. NPDC000348 TaxID=3364538 RepID=UPI0036C687A3
MEQVGPRADLRALAQGGVLLTARALNAGWPQSSLTARLHAEGWTRVQNGAWVVPGKVIDLGVRLRVTQLLTPRLVVSHHSAARLWQIETLGAGSAERVEFTDPGLSFRGRLTGVRVHRLPLVGTDVEYRGGLRVTDVPRTLADLLRSGGRDNALVAVESALGYRRVAGVRPHRPRPAPAPAPPECARTACPPPTRRSPPTPTRRSPLNRPGVQARRERDRGPRPPRNRRQVADVPGPRFPPAARSLLPRAGAGRVKGGPEGHRRRRRGVERSGTRRP